MMINEVLEKPSVYGVIDYDGLWKKLINELFKEFMLFFAPSFYDEIDFTKEPEFLQQELFQEIIKEKKGKQVADQIVKVFLKAGDEKWVLIHIEVQGDRDQDFSKRMFRYYYRIFDKYDRDIVAIALLTDHSKNYRPNLYHHSYQGTEITYKYNVYKFNEQDEHTLLQSTNPFAIAVLAGMYANESKDNKEKRYRFKLKLIQFILQKRDYSDEERRIYVSTLIYFIDYLLQIPKELTEKLRNEIILTREEKAMIYLDRNNLPPSFDELEKIVRAEGIEQGIEEGKKEGKKEVKRKIAKRMLKEGFPIDIITKMTELSEEEIRNL